MQSRSCIARQLPRLRLLAELVVLVLGVLGWTLFLVNLKKFNSETAGPQMQIRELQREKESLLEDKGKLQRENDDLRSERDNLRRERDELGRERDELRKERDDLRSERDELRRERDELRKERDNLRSERDELRKERDELRERQQKCETLLEKQKAAQDETIKKLSDENKGLYSTKKELEGNLQNCEEAQLRHSREIQECKKKNEHILERLNSELKLAQHNRGSKSCENQGCNFWWWILCFVLSFYLARCCDGFQ
ncbi:golgin subfamily A member 6-like protein 7 [Mobula hypostoma]|uniref:golgin subfamily A member 6-like protein 7 n=1 Tax=Mobula hypostoma TaxID=723540 RepID=UPI002FC29DCE